MENSKIRSWWAHRQGLDGAIVGKPAHEVLRSSGWVRSVGGSNPYLTLFSRAGLNREKVDDAVAKMTIHELPSARGCAYVLPESDFAFGLKVGQGFAGEMKVAEKLDVPRKEIDRLCDSIVAALESGPLDPEGLKGVIGDAVRNLGPEGQKKGLTTTLPVALEKLQLSGMIRRAPINGRLDQQRYKYSLWRPNPLQNFKLSEAESYTELARRFFAWIGPATMAEFQKFSGLGVKAAKLAVQPLKLENLAPGDDRLLLPGDREELEAFKPPKEPRYTLVGSLDSVILFRKRLEWLLDPKDLGREVFVDKKFKPIGELTELPSNAILDRGRIVGLWEFDPTTASIAWTSFVKKDKSLQDEVARVEQYVRAELGDARSFSLDSPKSRKPRIEALRSY